MGILIKMNDEYYDASEKSYDTENQIYKPIGDTNSDINEMLINSSLTIDYLNHVHLFSDNTINVTPIMTSNNTPSPYVVSASSEYNTSTYPPWKAFNRTNSSSSDCWITKSGVYTGWIMMDFNTKTTINSFQIVSRNYSFVSAPKDFALYGSNDGVDFFILKECKNEIGWKVNETREYNLVEDASYRYYKINIDSSTAEGTYTAIGCIKFLYKSITERFKVIDKFNNFTIINQYNEHTIFNLNGINSNHELILNSEDIKVKKDVVNLINYLYTTCEGDVKLAFSLDGGNTWLSHYNGNFINLLCKLPQNDYSSLTVEERILWESALKEIKTYGISADNLKNLDIVAFNFSKIKFAYVITRQNYRDNVSLNDLIMNYDKQGHLIKMKKSEFDTMIYDYGLQIKPLISNPVVKVNALLKETIRDNSSSSDKRIKVEAPILELNELNGVAKLTWNSTKFADYYKIYFNGNLYSDSNGLSIDIPINNVKGICTFIVRAYAYDTTKYKPSDFSNACVIDSYGYLGNKNNSDNSYNYVGIRIGDKVYKFKVKN